MRDAPCHLNLSKVTVVDYAAVTTPVLVIGGECDRMVPARAVRKAAARYRHGTCVEIVQSDHMVFSGDVLSLTMSHIDDGLLRIRILADASCREANHRMRFQQVMAATGQNTL